MIDNKVLELSVSMLDDVLSFAKYVEADLKRGDSFEDVAKKWYVDRQTVIYAAHLMEIIREKETY